MPQNLQTISAEEVQALIAPALQLFFYLFLIFFAIFTTFLFYHWLSYGTNKKHSTVAVGVFLAASAPFLITMYITAFL